ncbi:zinc finger protein [Anaeramoeba flamelloides]|uniref:Zinc finger protein n=1 Tax=Anaeramoeba flamelloides TaxID=1746091 RepID=A0AAV7YFC9_9EUKA|nr:zinc finger protein [Anaeramoeba flamelloides]
MTKIYVPTCNTCKLDFYSRDSLIKHYKTDLHQFNLIRKTQEQMPYSQTKFEEFLDFKREELKNKKNKRNKSKKKSKTSKNSTQQTIEEEKEAKLEKIALSMLKTTKKEEKGKTGSHYWKSKEVIINADLDEQLKTNLFDYKRIGKNENYEGSDYSASSDEEETAKEVEIGLEKEEEEEEGDEIQKDFINNSKFRYCIFCKQTCDSTQQAIEHMTVVHNFYIPNFEQLTDPIGFFKTIAYGVWKLKSCCYCQKKFKTISAVQQHIKNSGHTKLNLKREYLQQFDQFYNEEFIQTRNNKENINYKIDETTGELVLQNGKRIGSRHFRNQYKQNIDLEWEEKMKKIHKSMKNKYLALGWIGNTLDNKQAKKIVRQSKKYHKYQSTNKMSTELKGNRLRKLDNILQKH